MPYSATLVDEFATELSMWPGVHVEGADVTPTSRGDPPRLRAQGDDQVHASG